MRIDTPNLQAPESGEYRVRIGKGYGDPRGSIILDETHHVELENVRLEDCDRLIKAAAEIKAGILGYRAEMAAPHGRAHVHEGTCQLCGKPEDDELHAEPAPVITDGGERRTDGAPLSEQHTCDQKNPQTGDWCIAPGNQHGHHWDTHDETWTTPEPLPLACGCSVPLGHLNLFQPGHPVECVLHGPTTVAEPRPAEVMWAAS
jgi:hypothetical protein